MYCAKCGSEMSVRDIFCANCGAAAMPPAAGAQPGMPAMTKDDARAMLDNIANMKCPICGGGLVQGAETCPGCGAAIGRDGNKITVKFTKVARFGGAAPAGGGANDMKNLLNISTGAARSDGKQPGTPGNRFSASISYKTAFDKTQPRIDPQGQPQIIQESTGGRFIFVIIAIIIAIAAALLVVRLS